MRHILATFFLVAFLVACDPSDPVWFSGDSIAAGATSRMRPVLYPAVAGGAGFTRHADSLILDKTLAQVREHGAPEMMLVMGGVNDVGATPAELVAGLERFKAALARYRVRLVWVAEPAYGSRVRATAPVVAWMLGQPDSIDCRWHAGLASDGIHPDDYTTFGRCLSDRLKEV